jgi:Tol biopolymer transport system component
VTITAPPRPPRPSDPVNREELEALVEALIEEARRRAQRRRRRNAAVVTIVALVGVALFAVVGRSAQSQTASPALSARSSLAAATASSKIAFISEPPGGGYCGVVYVMNPDGSGQRRLANGAADPGPGCGSEGDPAWSPDGRKIAIAGINLDGKSGIYVMNADGSGQRELTPGGSPAWSPDGRKIAYTTVRDGTLEVDVVNADGSGKFGLPGSDGLFFAGAPAWSPDGRRIAFASGRDGNPAIYVMNADGSGQRNLTRNSARCTNACPSAGRDSNPVWSPDGRRIAFVSKSQVYVMNADGSRQLRLTRNGARNFAPAWSPDGQRIAFERRVGREKDGRCDRCGRAVTFQVYVMNADGSEARMLAQGGLQPVWSPDGQKIAFVRESRSPRQSDIYVMNADGSGQRNLTRGAGRHESSPVWSPAQK